ncbi:hypothetical protein [Paludifilum halophilum]|uniref:Uncharacterized protein n=1 Tax=Paludifilum halophilum TaxID=1642702 RepID=A0A235B9V1_9BACL|nr:hypothetical protein [Paludifilum halophilum]OYD08779.1 hypothetical protein CHM34_03000 [Paludifilum halophilum]
MNGFVALNSMAGVSGVVVPIFWSRLVRFIGMDPYSYDWLMIQAGGQWILMFMSVTALITAKRNDKYARDITFATGLIGFIYAQVLWTLPGVLFLVSGYFMYGNNSKSA